jgi:hypothetical protein
LGDCAGEGDQKARISAARRRAQESDRDHHAAERARQDNARTKGAFAVGLWSTRDAQDGRGELGEEVRWWTKEDGVFSFRLHVRPEGGKIPRGARVIFFEGHVDPWSPFARKMCPWIAEHWT